MAAGVPTADLHADFIRRVPASRIFFPAKTVHGALAWDHAFGAYAFVEVEPGAPVHRLERSRYVDRVVRSPDGQTFEALTADQMQAVFKAARPRPLRRGSKVKILSGEWEGMKGRVREVSRPDYKVAVQIRLHSRQIVVQASLHEVERV